MTDLERLIAEVQREHRAQMTERGRKRSTWSHEIHDEDRQQHCAIGMRRVRDTHVKTSDARRVLQRMARR